MIELERRQYMIEMNRISGQSEKAVLSRICCFVREKAVRTLM